MSIVDTMKSLMGLAPGMISCREFDDFIVDFLDGNLSPAQQRVFNFHMKICPLCRDYLEAYKLSMELGKRAYRDDDAPVPDDVPEDLVAAVLAARSAGPEPSGTQDGAPAP